VLNTTTLHALAIVIRGTIVSCLVAALLGAISFCVAGGLRLLWNAFSPDRAMLPPITYWQASLVGLFLAVAWNVTAWWRSA